ncbi:hypothetical protein K438DRAFT_1784241 [Mycena galopus ATCC 62051]|nr:hypothetical protein K438DRAFT_1784241 [Mycena galopus ATCC 62051]
MPAPRLHLCTPLATRTRRCLFRLRSTYSSPVPPTPHPYIPPRAKTDMRNASGGASRSEGKQVDKGSAAVKGYEEEGGKVREARTAPASRWSVSPAIHPSRRNSAVELTISRTSTCRNQAEVPEAHDQMPDEKIRVEVVDGGGRAESEERARAEAEAGQEASRDASRMGLIGIGAPAKVEQRK